MSSRKRSNSVQSSEPHSEAASPRRRVVRRAQNQNIEDISDGSDSEQETRRNRLKKKYSQKRASNPNQNASSKSKPNVPNHIKIGKSIFFEQTPSIDNYDEEEFEYFDSKCVCDQKMKEHFDKTPMSSLILLNRIERFKKQQLLKRAENKDDEQILLDIIEKEGLYTKKEIEGHKNVNFENSCDPLLTQEERLQVIKRLKEQHELYRRLEKRDRKHQIYQLRCVIPHVSNEEALFALKLTNNIEEEAIIKLTDYTFLQQIRKEIALEYNPNPSLTVDHLVTLADKWNYEQDQNSPESPSSMSNNETPSTSTSFVQSVEPSRSTITSRIDEMSEEEEEDDQDDDDFVIKERKKPANKPSKVKPKKSSKKNSKKSKQEESQSECEMEEDEEISEIDEEIEEEETNKKKRKRKISNSISSSRLLLDDALSDTIKKDGWSKARIEAYEKINTNPNAYYYRFNEPGESQKNGKWSQKEKELFVKKLKEYVEETDSFQWGLFSKRIPGRVGYQCSNFYRTLLKSGDFKVDLVEECKNKSGGSSSSSKSSNTSKKRRKPTTPTRTKSKKKKVEPSDDDDDDEGINQNDSESVSSHTGSSSNNSKSDSESSEESSDDSYETNSRNILEDFIDPITQEQVKDPAISPYGHVLGYQTWLKVLNTEPKNTCPYTKQTLTKRNLVKLNFDNIEEFESKIRNFN